MFLGASSDPLYVFGADPLLHQYLRTQAGYGGWKNDVDRLISNETDCQGYLCPLTLGALYVLGAVIAGRNTLSIAVKSDGQLGNFLL